MDAGRQGEGEDKGRGEGWGGEEMRGERGDAEKERKGHMLWA